MILHVESVQCINLLQVYGNTTMYYRNSYYCNLKYRICPHTFLVLGYRAEYAAFSILASLSHDFHNYQVGL